MRGTEERGERAQEQYGGCCCRVGGVGNGACWVCTCLFSVFFLLELFLLALLLSTGFF